MSNYVGVSSFEEFLNKAAGIYGQNRDNAERISIDEARRKRIMPLM